MRKRISVDGNRIRQLREARDWRQADLAKKSLLTQPQIHRAEKNWSTQDNLKAIAKALGVKPEDLRYTATPGEDGLIPAERVARMFGITVAQYEAVRPLIRMLAGLLDDPDARGHIVRQIELLARLLAERRGTGTGGRGP